MKSILKSSTFWLAILLIVANVLEMVLQYKEVFHLTPAVINIIGGILFILNRWRTKTPTNVYVFRKLGTDAKTV